MVNQPQQLRDFVRERQVLVIACYPRSVRWLLHRAGLVIPVDVINLHDENKDSIPDEYMVSGKTSSRQENIELPSDWVPWFPVIDNDRCRQCGQCMNFCLFGVYQRDSQEKIAVENPSHCKTNCPACSRVCPHQAIIFPKYDQPPYNGSPIEEDASPTTQDRLQAMLQGDVYSALRQRNKAGNMKMDPKKLKELQDKFDIPQSVFTNLKTNSQDPDPSEGESHV